MLLFTKVTKVGKKRIVVNAFFNTVPGIIRNLFLQPENNTQVEVKCLV
jgi:hypothetical protein